MKKCRLKLASIVLVVLGNLTLAQTIPSADPEEVGLSSERLNRLHSVMQEYVDDERVAGIVTLVARRGKLADFEAYGHLDRESGKPMVREAIFRIASQSKAVTSVGILILQEEGSLQLSDHLSKFVPEFKNPQVAITREDGAKGYTLVPAKKEITIRDLLTHTAGISYGHASPARSAHKWDDLQGWFFAGHDETIGDAIRRLGSFPLVAQPGEKWVYGFSTDILGYVIEVVSGKSLAEFFQERIFEPLQMIDTHFFLPEEKVERLSPVYGAMPDGKIELVESQANNEYVQGPRRCFSGGAGLLSTSQDYTRFLLMLLNGGELDGVRILSRKSVELMSSNHVGNLYGDKGFGLGFWITEDIGKGGELDTVGAYGWGGAYYTTYWLDPKEQLVALLMCQLLPAGSVDLHERFRTLVYQSIND